MDLHIINDRCPGGFVTPVTATLPQESLEVLSLDEEKNTDEMWAGAGEAAHDVPDHAGTRTP